MLISPTLVVKSKTIKTMRQAFTLLELVIVVLIMGLIYSMVSVSMTHSTKTLSTLSPLNLPNFLASQNDLKERSFYLYGDTCEHLKFVPNLEDEIAIDKISFKRDTSAYWFDNYGTMQKIDFAPTKTEHSKTKVCLKFEHFANGSHTPMVIQSGSTFYYHTFLDGVKTFTSLEEAAQWIEHAEINPDNLGLY